MIRRSIFTAVAIVSIACFGSETRIPEKFFGTWDQSIAACSSQYSDLRIHINALSVRYWETEGTVDTVKILSENRLLATLTMSSEGENWKRVAAFHLEENGHKLVETVDDIRPIKRYRCEVE